MIGFINGEKLFFADKATVTPQYQYDIDLRDSKYDRNKWYPVDVDLSQNDETITKTLSRGLIFLQLLDKDFNYSVPWGTWNNRGATASFLFDYTLSDWGNRPKSFGYILDKTADNGAEKPLAIGICLPQHSKDIVLSLRGGAPYHLFLDLPGKVKISTNDLTTAGNESFKVSDSPLNDGTFTDLVDLLSNIKSKLGGKSPL